MCFEAPCLVADIIELPLHKCGWFITGCGVGGSLSGDGRVGRGGGRLGDLEWYNVCMWVIKSVCV